MTSGPLSRAAALPFLLLAVVAACQDAGAPANLLVTPDSVSLEVGDTVTLTVLGDGDAVTHLVSWVIDDPDVATMIDQGLLVGLAIGKTAAHASLRDLTAQATVVVGPLLMGSWSGTADTVIVSITLNRSPPGGFTGLGAVRLGTSPSVAVSAVARLLADSVTLRMIGTGIVADFDGRILDGDALVGMLVLNGGAPASLTLRRR